MDSRTDSDRILRITCVKITDSLSERCMSAGRDRIDNMFSFDSVLFEFKYYSDYNIPIDKKQHLC